MTDVVGRLQAALSVRYAIENELGAGGMATVYLAEDLRHARKVAIKVLRAEVAGAVGSERFLREIGIVAKLNHPHILPLYDSGEAGGLLYYVMPLAEGESLRDRLDREKQLSLEDACQIARDVASALDYAHAQKVVHRDIKPENIMLEPGGAIVTDFGIARAVSEAGGGSLTETGITLGTPPYMSPEQATGSGDIDHRSDVYSLACVAYEMLAGEPPFTGPTAEIVLRKHIATDSPSLIASRPGLPAELDIALRRGLLKTPADRFGSASQLAAALAGGLAAFETGTGLGRTASRRSVWRQRVARYSGLLGIALVLLVAVPLLWPRLSSREVASRQGAEAIPDRNRLAVLPLANISPDSADAYFADGLTEELIAQLSKLSALRVIARASVWPYKGTQERITDIGRALAVGTILDGSVRKVGDQVRVSVQLVETQSEERLWSQEYDAELTNVFTVQNQIAQHVAEALDVELEVSEQRQLAKRGTDSPEAYELYLKGRYSWNKRTPADLRQSKTLFEDAIDLDPVYAQAWAGLADAYLMLGWTSELPRQEALAVAKAAAERALSLDDELVEAHTALATILHDNWEWGEAGTRLERALELNPSYALVHQRYSNYLATWERLDEAVTAARRAQALDPLSLYTEANVGWILYLARRYDEAIEQLHKTRSRDPDFFLTYLNLGLVYSQTEQFGEAISAFQKARSLSGDDVGALGLLGYAYARAGRQNEARAILDTLTRRSNAQPVSRFHFAVLYTGLGDFNRALEALEQAVEKQELMTTLPVEPIFDPLRADARFEAVLETLGL